MATSLHTFIDIFHTEFEVEQEMVSLKKIIIPIIQRDYAQGRKDRDTARVRSRLLDSLHKAITETPITLDFVYGDVKANGVMTPLDGQQRLTTLFLLHWYAAKKEGIEEEKYGFLRNFSYETRYSARDFCEYLIDYKPSFEGILSEELIDQAWFPLEWKKDPTIQSMLTMLDAISEKFARTEDIWEKLENGAINFYFLPVKEMGLTDELYIKMNSRGKPLTQFEHFKAELEKNIKEIDEDIAKRILRKVDLDWTDLLWTYRGEDNIIDDEFLRYFRFITDLLCYQNGGSTQGKYQSDFELLKTYFSKDSKDVIENLLFLEKCFDCWCRVRKECGISAFFEKFIALEHVSGKIVFENKVNILEDCLQTYANIQGNGNRTFPLNRIILLYAFVSYLIAENSIEENEFARRLRIIHNLVRNSEDEISDSDHRSAGNRMPAILRQVNSIVTTGIINKQEANNFNSFQLEEETIKQPWMDEHPEYVDSLQELEDHPLLKGQISVVGLENPDRFSKFVSLFQCDWDLVDCALLSIADYGQLERNGWKYQLGSSKLDKAWINLFHKSANQGFEKTKNALCELLDMVEPINDDSLEKVKREYLEKCEECCCFEWRYYYIKYKTFRPGRYGKYSWRRTENGSYNFHAFWTESQWSQNSYQPFLYEVAPKLISRDDLGHLLKLGDYYMSCENAGFYTRAYGTDEEIECLPICRNDQGIDIENRIEKFRAYLQDKNLLQ